MPDPILVQGTLRIRGSGVALPTCHTPAGPREAIANSDVQEVLAAGARSEREALAVGRLLASGGGQLRHWSHWIGADPHPEEPDAADLAVQAARAALDDAGLTVTDLDLVILALSTSTLPTIATTSPVCERLGYVGPSFDLKAGCAGSLYAMHLASVLLGAGYRRILVIGADTMSKYLDRQSLMGFLTVGDGAGALVLEPGTPGNFVSLLDGEYSTWASAGVFGALPPRLEEPEAYVFRGAPTQLKEGIARAYHDSLSTLLERTGTAPEDLAGWVPHAIALPLLVEVAGRFPGLRLFHNFDRFGNTGSASLLIALHEARRELEGAIALSALGGGMRWGAARWSDWT